MVKRIFFAWAWQTTDGQVFREKNSALQHEGGVAADGLLPPGARERLRPKVEAAIAALPEEYKIAGAGIQRITRV